MWHRMKHPLKTRHGPGNEPSVILLRLTSHNHLVFKQLLEVIQTQIFNHITDTMGQTIQRFGIGRCSCQKLAAKTLISEINCVQTAYGKSM